MHWREKDIVFFRQTRRVSRKQHGHWRRKHGQNGKATVNPRNKSQERRGTANVETKPKRGEIYWVDFEPARSVEQGGRRPALVVQNDRGNQNSNYTVVAAISSAPLPRVYP